MLHVEARLLEQPYVGDVVLVQVREQHVFDVIGLQAVLFEAPPDRLRAGADHLVGVPAVSVQVPLQSPYGNFRARSNRGRARCTKSIAAAGLARPGPTASSAAYTSLVSALEDEGLPSSSMTSMNTSVAK